MEEETISEQSLKLLRRHAYLLFNGDSLVGVHKEMEELRKELDADALCEFNATIEATIGYFLQRRQGEPKTEALCAHCGR